MKTPYTGEALATLEKMHTFRSYTPNKLYLSPYNRIYYINNAGYLHTYDLGTGHFNGKPLYIIRELMLTTDNKLKETSRKYSHDRETVRADYLRLMEEANRNTPKTA